MSTLGDSGPISLRRADFLAVLWAVMGVFLLASALGDGIPNELLSLDAFFVANGLVFLAGTVFYRRRPDSSRRGREPTPALWFVLAGTMIGALALFFVLVVAV